MFLQWVYSQSISQVSSGQEDTGEIGAIYSTLDLRQMPQLQNGIMRLLRRRYVAGFKWLLRRDTIYEVYDKTSHRSPLRMFVAEGVGLTIRKRADIRPWIEDGTILQEMLVDIMESCKLWFQGRLS